MGWAIQVSSPYRPAISLRSLLGLAFHWVDRDEPADQRNKKIEAGSKGYSHSSSPCQRFSFHLEAVAWKMMVFMLSSIWWLPNRASKAARGLWSGISCQAASKPRQKSLSAAICCTFRKRSLSSLTSFSCFPFQSSMNARKVKPWESRAERRAWRRAWEEHNAS